MIYILDTDLFTLVEIPDSSEYVRLRARVAQLPREDEVVTTIITYEEQTRGWLAYAAKARHMEHQVKAYARLKRHLHAYLKIGVLDFDATAAAEFQRLFRLKLRIGTLDLKIAAIARSCNATLLTRNLIDFARVPGLRAEDWTRG
jgi:tRNA(fMet)-specific endonuclease VapC